MNREPWPTGPDARPIQEEEPESGLIRVRWPHGTVWLDMNKLRADMEARVGGLPIPWDRVIRDLVWELSNELERRFRAVVSEINIKFLVEQELREMIRQAVRDNLLAQIEAVNDVRDGIKREIERQTEGGAA